MATYKGYLQDKNGDILLPNVSWENIIDKPNPYPIGAIYLSVDATNPSKLFGGTWEQIKDRFLLACGNTYSNGRTGGRATHTHSTGNHTLTVEEMPKHNHNAVSTSGINDTSIKLYPFNMVTQEYSTVDNHVIIPAGGDKPHNHGNTGSSNNIPPYLAVYVWKRTK